MAQFNAPLPKITLEELTRAWTRFKLVAAAKEWSTEWQAAILSTLLRGKLVDHYMYVELGKTNRADMKQFKTALMTKAGVTKDPVTVGKMFIPRCQCPGKKAKDFADELKKLLGGLTQSKIYPRTFCFSICNCIVDSCESPGVVAQEAHNLRTGN